MNGDTPHINGHASSRDDASVAGSVASTSSSVAGHSNSNGYQVPYSHNDEILNHLYNAFNTGVYGDTTLHVRQNSYSLHALLLIRSPTLAHLISTATPVSSNPRIIIVDIEREPEISLEGFHIALGYLYSSVSMRSVRPENAKAVLAAACYLGGMESLAAYAYDVCRESISVETISQWLTFIASVEATPSHDTPTSVFGPYAERLKDDLFQFIVSLPTSLGLAGAEENPEAHAKILNVYSLMPFDLFKSALESPAFRIGSDQQRFKFAKEAITKRKAGIARGTGAEESVVLAFGQSGSNVIHITRKIKNRKLWKVSSP